MLNLLTKFVGGILWFLIAIVIVIPLTLCFSHAQDQGSAVETRASGGLKNQQPRIDPQPDTPVDSVEKQGMSVGAARAFKGLPSRSPPDDDR
jgi:hypothetical protein